MQNLTVDQILGQLNPHFHDDFLNKTSKIIRPEEKYWGAGNWSFISHGEFLGKYGYAEFGYLLVTSYRVIDVTFQPESGLFAQKREAVRINGVSESAYLGIMFPLTDNEIKTRYLTETPLKKIDYIRKDDLIGYKDGKNIGIISLSYEIGTHRYFTDLKQANELYGLLTDIVHGTSLQVVQVPNLAEQLEKLTDLHRYQVITDEEFAAAKKRLGL